MAKRVCVVMALVFMLSACGYRGALYLPKEAPATPANKGAQATPPSSGDVR
ncbi:MAG: lipoprotein [Pseudomonadota bacterium]|uniref:LPS translocon maturation chaperone LptM n=1 Tax=Marisediminitalea TaxID=2662254 RepID=UPI001114EBAD|nr:lipoprotein [Marisediminitalea aggregata]MCP3862091.1 hypothetical protein [Aestuariibacter sp.]MEC7468580.1 lipoprotein [Pseudomonadota bacterium]MCP4232457.1 hypothetical protein [Aestuariibacter sp.]MCP4529331.1 hypothetical protein [Aestuariibacter sp.]MCP4946410.1 hypothetical protein [Aestuariibacter sp.]